MPQLMPNANIVVTVASGYREQQIRPFLASLRYFSPETSLKLIVGRADPEFETAVRSWFPKCTFHLIPPTPWRDFARKRKWARSILKRAVRWSGSQRLALQLLGINYQRHIIVRDLLVQWNLKEANLLFCDSRDVVFQNDPFLGEWPALWTCEEDKKLEECHLNSSWFSRIGGEEALQRVKHRPIVCAGVVGGTVQHLSRYFMQSSMIVERMATKIPLTEGDQGIHNNLVWLQPELEFTVVANGSRLAANVANTKPADLRIEGGVVRIRNRSEAPAVLHQYDRHPELKSMIEARWRSVTPNP